MKPAFLQGFYKSVKALSLVRRAPLPYELVAMLFYKVVANSSQVPVGFDVMLAVNDLWRLTRNRSGVSSGAVYLIEEISTSAKLPGVAAFTAATIWATCAFMIVHRPWPKTTMAILRCVRFCW